MKVARLSALCTGRLYSQGHSAGGKVMSMKNSNGTIGNQFRDLPVCSAVPRPLRHRVGPPPIRGSTEFANEWNQYSYLVVTEVISMKLGIWLSFVKILKFRAGGVLTPQTIPISTPVWRCCL
jgi:hypothetical protein